MVYLRSRRVLHRTAGTSLLQKADLLRYGQYGLSARVVDRLWTLRREPEKEGMGYNDFVYFLLAEEDKESAPALQYWFHVLDYDADGCICAKDMWYRRRPLLTTRS